MSEKPKTHGKARFYIMLIVVVVIVFGGIYGLKWYNDYKSAQLAASAPKQYQTISSGKAKKVAWYPHAASVASIVSVVGVNVTTQVAGKIIKIEFDTGQMVEKGQEILRLEDFAEVQQLNNYLATMRINKITMDRQHRVYKAGLISEEEYDEAKAAYEEALANVQMEQANIDYKHIKAPFSGLFGINRLNLGQYLSAGDTIANLQTIQPIFADFSLPEQFFNGTKKGQYVSLTIPTMPGKTFVGEVYGKSSMVDPMTRNYTVRATFTNERKLLKPGMFANADLRTGAQQQVVVIPRTAIVYSLYGNSIYTLTQAGSDKQGKLYKIKQITADLGEVIGTNVIVKSGLKVGDQVVVSGQLKVVNGNTVRVSNSVKLTPLKKSELTGP